MEVYVIANIRTNRNIIKGYRLIDISNNIQILDVTKDQLLYVLKRKKLKLENAKHNGNKIIGIYSPLDELDNIICSDENVKDIRYISSNYKYLVLKYTEDYKNIVICDSHGTVREIGFDDFKNLVACSKILNVNGLAIKAKKYKPEVHEVTVPNKNYITDEMARDYTKPWSIKTFMQYMEQRGYAYILEDYQGFAVNCSSDQFDIEKYQITEFTLRDVDKRCKIIHIPEMVTDIDKIFNLYEEDEIVELDTLIVHDAISFEHGFGNFVNDKIAAIQTALNIENTNRSKILWLKTKNLYFQPRFSNNYDESNNYSNLTNIEITEDYNLPSIDNKINVNEYILNRINKEGYRIKYVFNRCKLPFVPNFQNKYIYSLNSCFNATLIKNNNNVLNLDNIMRISHSFQGCNLDYVIIGNKLTSISNSFGVGYKGDPNYIGEIEHLPNIDFSNSIIDYIYGSFNYVNGNSTMKVLDLSHIKTDETLTISRSFMSNLNYECNVEQVVLPDISLTISNKSFKGFKQVKKVIVPSKIKTLSVGCFNEDTELDWSKTGYTVASASLVGGSPEKTLRLSDNFVEIERRCFAGIICDNIGVMPSITKIGAAAFISSNIIEFDSMSFPNLRGIPKSLFKGSDSLAKVAIQNNIKKIEELAFDCKKIQDIFIGDACIDIHKDAFKVTEKSYTDRDKIKRVYVIKNSYAHKYFKNKRSVVLMTYDNYNEAYRAYNKQGNTSKAQVAKFKLIMGNNEEYQELLGDEYINNSTEIYNTGELCKRPAELFEGNLDKSKLNFSGPYVKDLNDGLFSTYNNVMKNIDTEELYVGEFTKPFAGYCNLYTSIASNDIEIMCTKEGLQVMNMTNFSTIRFIYFDARCTIIMSRIRTISNWVDNIIIITIDDRIVFCSLLSNSLEKLTFSSYANLFVAGNIINKSYTARYSDFYNKYSVLCDRLKVGDYWSEKDFTINGVIYPNNEKYHKPWDSALKCNWILLNTESERSFYANVPSDKTAMKFYVYDIITQKVMLLQIKARLDSVSFSIVGTSRIIDSYRYVIIQKEMTLSKFLSSKESENFRRLLRYVNNDDLRTKVKLIALDDNEREKLFNAKDAYDNNSNTKLIQLANNLYNSNANIKNISEKQVEMILKSDLCKITNINVEKAVNKIGNPSVISIPNSEKIIIQFSISNDKAFKIPRNQNGLMLYAMVSMEELAVDTVLYSSYFKFDELISKIKRLALPLEGEEMHSITNKPININDFTTLISFNSYFRNGIRTYFDVALQNQTGECYLLANTDDIDYYTIFRFKNFYNADKFIYDIDERDDLDTISYGTKVSGYQKILDSILSNEDYSNRDLSGLCEMREHILDGIPNNYVLNITSNKMFNCLSKQPGKKTLEFC